MNYLQISSELKKLAPESSNASKFFKTTPGSYAEHDIFIGVAVPKIRDFAKNLTKLPLPELKNLLSSKINEERLLSLIILVNQYDKANLKEKEEFFQFYLANMSQINNWNLVDSSAHLIIGRYLFDKNKDLLITLANSKILWERRIAILATWHFIKNNQFEWTIKLSTILLNDKHDLMHKAVGWMLREMGKKDIDSLKDFLEKHIHKMPRTMLRYAIEKFSIEERKAYLNK